MQVSQETGNGDSHREIWKQFARVAAYVSIRSSVETGQVPGTNNYFKHEDGWDAHCNVGTDARNGIGIGDDDQV